MAPGVPREAQQLVCVCANEFGGDCSQCREVARSVAQYQRARRIAASILHLALVETRERDVANDSFLMQVKDYQTGNQFIYCFGRCRGAESRTEEFMDKLVLGAAALALSAGA